jgi:hypothetical protein
MQTSARTSMPKAIITRSTSLPLSGGVTPRLDCASSDSRRNASPTRSGDLSPITMAQIL